MVHENKQIGENLFKNVLKQLIGFLRNISRNTQGRREIVQLKIPL